MRNYWRGCYGVAGLLAGLLLLPAACAVSGAGDTDDDGTDGQGGTDCLVGASCSGDEGAGEPESPPPPPPPTCPYEGPPLVDPSSLPSCSMCGDGHCVPNGAVPSEFAGQLANCSADAKCVPDKFIVSMGKSVPDSCDSVAGLEGRCLSTCLPNVAEQADQLPQSSCDSGEKCVPCFDPFTLEATGACEVACDPGPAGEPQGLSECCSGIGHCVPKASVPADKVEQLLGEECAQDKGAMVCAPDVFINDSNYQPQTCSTKLLSILFGEEYKEGRCLPECMKDTEDSLFIHNDGCAPNFNCIPCIHPMTNQPTGACDL